MIKLVLGLRQSNHLSNVVQVKWFVYACVRVCVCVCVCACTRMHV